MTLTDHDMAIIERIEAKLPFHYNNRPIITKEEILFLLSRARGYLKLYLMYKPKYKGD